MLWLSEVLLQHHDLESFEDLKLAITGVRRVAKCFFAWT